MSLTLFFGCLIWVFGPLLALFIIFVAKKAQNVILSMGRYVLSFGRFSRIFVLEPSFFIKKAASYLAIVSRRDTQVTFHSLTTLFLLFLQCFHVDRRYSSNSGLVDDS